ncbi:MAG: Outer membrane protein assembly factor BamD [Phycisphaerae bacterium]|nr:Outer membrane protein assembly factor BamD [Phycisphaerae bacterium]
MNRRTVLSVALGSLCLAAWAAAPLRAQPAGGSTAADNTYFMGTWHYGEGRWTQAAEEFQKYLQKYPDQPRAADAMFGLAQSQFQLGKYKESAETFKQLRETYKTFDKSAEAQFQLGQCYLGTQQLKLAADAFGETASRFKSHYLAEWAEAKRAECYLNLGQHPQAEGILEPLVEKYVRGPQAAKNLAARMATLKGVNPQLADSFKSLITRADWNLSMAQFGQKKYEQAARGFADFLERNPSSELAEFARYHRAQSLYFLKQYDQAAKSYEQVVSANGRLAPAAAFERALAIYHTGDLPAGAKAFAEAAEKFPKAPEADKARLYAGTCLYENNNFEQAISHFDELITANKPGLTDEAKYWKGMALLKRDRAGEAQKVFEEAIRSHPQSARLADLRLAQADSLLAQKKYPEAASAYEAFVTSHPTHAAVPRALYTAAQSLHYAGQWDASGKVCDRFLTGYPTDAHVPEVLFIAAEDQFWLKNYPAAQKLYTNLLDKYADKSADADKARLRLAWTLYFQSQYDQALAPLGRISDKADAAIASEALYLKGNCYFEQKKDDEASRALSEYLAKPVGTRYVDDALYKVSVISVRQDKPDAAVGPLNKLIAEHPDSPLRVQTEFQLAEVLYSRKKFDEATGHYQEVLKRDPKGTLAPYAAFGIGLCGYDQQKWKESAEAFANVIQTYPEATKLLPQSYYRQGLSLQNTGQWAVAESAFNDLVKKFPTDQHAPSALKAVGLGQEKQEQYDRAIKTFERIIKDYPSSSELDQAWYELAWCYQKLDNRDQMLKAYKTLSDKYPDSPLVADAWFHLAEDQYKQENYAAALDLYEKSMAKAPDERLKDKALYRIGWCYWMKQDYARAADFFDKLIELYPNSDLLPDALLNGGEAHLRNGQAAKAADRLTKLITGPAAKDSKFAGLPDAYLYLGEADIQLGQNDDALKILQLVPTKFPKYDRMSEVDFAIGRAMFERKEYDEAIKRLNAVVDSDSAGVKTRARAQFYIGEAYLAPRTESGAHEAIKAFFRVTVLYGRYPECLEWVIASHYDLGQAYLLLKQKPEAIQMFKNVVEKYPNSKYAAQARQQLAQLEKEN